MRIQHNIAAMSAYRNYTNNTSAVSKNLEKLSSGYKINRAGDDAAGLAISEKMRAQITGLETAQKNAKDGISLVQTAEGALTEVHDMLNRMVELATQSANGTYDNETDRAQLQKELDQLRDEINRIADSSNFNGIKLLDGSMEAGGGGTNVEGIDRIIDTVLAADEDPIDKTGERTILDAGDSSSANTVFNVDFTGLKGAVEKTEGDDTDTDAPKTLTATSTTEANNNATPAVPAYGEFTLGTGITAIGGASNIGDFGNIELSDGVKISDLFDLDIGGAKDWTTDATTTFAAGNVIKLTAKNAGALTEEQAAAFKALADGTDVTVDDTTFTTGVNEGGAAAAVPNSYELTFDLSKIGGGQSFTINGQKFTVVTDGSTPSDGSTAIDINGKDAAGVAEAIVDALGSLTDFDVSPYDGGNLDTAGATPTYKLTLTAKEGVAMDEPIKVSTKDEEAGTTAGSIITVASNPGTPATDGDVGEYASVTYGGLKLSDVGVGTKISIGSTDIEVVAADDADVSSTGYDAASGKISVDALDKLNDLVNNTNYNVKLTDDGLTLTGKDKTIALTTLTKDAVTVEGAGGAGGGSDTVKFDFKLGGTMLAQGISVSSSATSAEIAQAVYDALDDPSKVQVDGVNYSVEVADGKLTFTLIDTPTADNIQGNYDWDVLADEGTFIGNHTAGTTVTTQGQVGAANAIANTVFRVEAGDIKDGATITVDGKTVTLAVGKDSAVPFTDKSGAAIDDIVDLRSMDASNIDLGTALGKIAEALGGAEGTEHFIIGVNNEANGDAHTGITVHKKEGAVDDDGNAVNYTTKEALAEVFSLTTPGTGKALTLQIGDTSDSYNQLKVDIKDCHTSSLGIAGIDISTQEGATDALDAIKNAINYVSDVRGTLGATQNRLEHTINNLSVMTENIQDAESTIRDTDIAEEMMAYTKNNILVQSAQAMLAQANQIPQGVLQLLG